MSIEDLKPIQRYEFLREDEDYFVRMVEDKDGEYCKWEDVEKVLDEVNKQLLDHLKDVLDSIADNRGC